jgi:hypothetical protein
MSGESRKNISRGYAGNLDAGSFLRPKVRRE